MLVHGMMEDGKDDSMLVDLAKKFTKLGFTVFVPDITGLKNSQLGYDEVNEVKVALSKMNELYPNYKKGVMSFCYGNGAVVPAVATDPQIKKEIDFLILWGSYAVLKDLLRLNMTGYYYASTEKKLISFAPEEYIEEDYMNQKIFKKYKNDPAVKKFLGNKDSKKFEQYYNDLPVEISKWFEFISPLTYIQDIYCPVIFIHPKRDSLAPHYESLKLYETCKAKHKRIILLSRFEHVDPSVLRQDLIQQDILRQVTTAVGHSLLPGQGKTPNSPATGSPRLIFNPSQADSVQITSAQITVPRSELNIFKVLNDMIMIYCLMSAIYSI